MRKWKSLLILACCAVLTLLTGLPVFAKDTDQYNVYIDYVESTGEKDTLEVSIESDGTCTDGLTYIHYDPSVLKINEDEVRNEGVIMYSVNDDTPGELAISWIAGEDAESGTLFEMDFEVLKKNAKTDLSISGEVYSGNVIASAGSIGTVGLPENQPDAQKPTQAEVSPLTGDSTPGMGPWVAVMGISVACLATLLVMSRKSKSKEGM